MTPDEPRIAHLVAMLAPFVPDRIVIIERGGRPLGEALGARFQAPVSGIDIGYPLSRLPSPILRAVVFPFKEIVYRLTGPKIIQKPAFLKKTATSNDRILLVDDSASSGKTLDLAIKTLTSAGIPRDNLRVAVGRVGCKAMSLVDAFISR